MWLTDVPKSNHFKGVEDTSPGILSPARGAIEGSMGAPVMVLRLEARKKAVHHEALWTLFCVDLCFHEKRSQAQSFMIPSE